MFGVAHAAAGRERRAGAHHLGDKSVYLGRMRECYWHTNPPARVATTNLGESNRVEGGEIVIVPSD
jgi:hypothetical protein